MNFSVFINFEGTCKQALDLYAKVFRSEVKGLMTFGQMPVDPSFPIAESDKDRVLYASMQIGQTTLMFSDVPSGMPVIQGTNISPTVGSADKEEVRRIFQELQQGGSVMMELQQTFFSEMYGMVRDPFGVQWQISYDKAAR